jgi:hypothetical protein
MRNQYPYTPRQLQDSRSAYAANLELVNYAAKHRPPPRYIQRAAQHNRSISAALPWILLFTVVSSIGIMLAWRG